MYLVQLLGGFPQKGPEGLRRPLGVELPHVAVIRAEELLKLREALRLDGARRLLKWLEVVKR